MGQLFLGLPTSAMRRLYYWLQVLLFSFHAKARFHLCSPMLPPFLLPSDDSHSLARRPNVSDNL